MFCWTAPSGSGGPDTIIGDTERELPPLGLDDDADRFGVRMPGDVGQHLAKRHQQLLGQGRTDQAVDRADELEVRLEPRASRMSAITATICDRTPVPGERDVELSAKMDERICRMVASRSSTACCSRSATSGRSTSREVACSDMPGREQLLDDRVVKVHGDPLAILEQRELADPGVEPGVLDGDASRRRQPDDSSSSMSLNTSADCLSVR